MTFKSLFKSLLIALFIIVACGHPLDYFYKEIASYGYHTYAHPMKVAGTGTMVSGSSRAVDIIAHPYTCFPKEIEKLRCRDETKLPSRTMDFSIDVDLQADFFNAMQTASPSIKAGFRMKEVHRTELVMKGIHIEYMDTMKLLEYYQKNMSDICKSSLQSGLSYITQVIRVDEMEFTFYKENNGKITIDADKINEYLDISLDIEWSIKEGTTLIIKTPKYIGYQLAKLIKEKDGLLTVYRTKSTGRDRWKFYEAFSVDPDSLETPREDSCTSL